MNVRMATRDQNGMRGRVKRFVVGVWRRADDVLYIKPAATFFALGIAVILLSKVNRDAMAIAVALAVLVMAYWFWRPAHDGEGNGVLAFAREVWKAVPILIALIACVGVVGALAGCGRKGFVAMRGLLACPPLTTASYHPGRSTKVSFSPSSPVIPLSAVLLWRPGKAYQFSSHPTLFVG